MKRKKVFVYICLYVLMTSMSAIFCQEIYHACTDYDCRGNVACINGIKEFRGCSELNPCVGGVYIQCQPQN